MKSNWIWTFACSAVWASGVMLGCNSSSNGGSGGSAGTGSAGTDSGPGGVAGVDGSLPEGSAAAAGAPGTGGVAGSGGASGSGGDAAAFTPLPSGCVIDASVAVSCNPLSNSGCDAAGGEACDLGMDMQGNQAFDCFPPPNPQQLGDACSNSSSGPFCAGMLHCANTNEAGAGTCGRWCCSSADCGGKACTPLDAQNLGTIGTCAP